MVTWNLPDEREKSTKQANVLAGKLTDLKFGLVKSHKSLTG